MGIWKLKGMRGILINGYGMYTEKRKDGTIS
jgi:hypothetical protein